MGDYIRSQGPIKTNLPKDILAHGRLVVPKLLFYFPTCPKDLRGSKGLKDLVKKDGTVSKHPPIKKLEFALEDQIFRIFRRIRLTANNPNSLFSLPSSREGFVYINSDRYTSSCEDSLQKNLNNIWTETAENTGETSSASCTEDEGQYQFTPYFYQQSVADHLAQGRNFSKFLNTHIEIVSGRRSGESDSKYTTIEMPTSAQWFVSASLMFPVYGGPVGSKLGECDTTASASNGFVRANSLLTHGTSVENRFSEARCAKSLPVAFSAYKEGLPTHYLEEYHNAKLLQAMSVFSLQGRGPFTAKYAEILIKDCNTYWQSGRQMCEELSLTGHHCSNRKHNVHGQQQPSESPGEGAEEIYRGEDNGGTGINRKLPTMPHMSSVTFLAACNCGRKQSNRDDPFTLKEANYLFYAEMEEECCRDLEKATVPTYQPKTSGSPSTQSKLALTTSSLKELTLDNPATSNASPNSVNTETKLADLAIPSTVEENKQETASASSLERQSTSLTELLPTMTTTSTIDSGRLPSFSSWALTQLGNASVYSHSSGVTQSGFLNNTRNLLPWDIPLRKAKFSVLQAKWPNLAEIAMKKPGFDITKGSIADLGITVKVFLGLEYECPRGHR